ncbi:DNA polymerase iota, partial [Ophiophagus hannah]
MEDSEGEEGEETEAEWLLPGPSSGLQRDPPGAVEGVSRSHGQAVPKGNAWNRIIVHLDLDCFYAQVEMICNPELRSKPLGVQQKYLVVTCNYEARNLGVTKLMGVKEAKEKCPDLILIAEEMRDAMCSGLGLTGCAGVATNKVLSKLVCGTFKPNQQTILLPENQQNLMASLNHLRKIPGIGFKRAMRLLNLGLCTVQDLQDCSAEILEKELGIPAAHLIQKLSWGEDHSPVIPSGAPQSLSDEDSFKKCSSEAEVKKKMEELLTNLLDRWNSGTMRSQLHTPCLPKASDLQRPSPLLPAGIDYDVFNQLPSDIKEEIISSQKKVRDSTETLWSQRRSELGEKSPCHPKTKISSISLHSGDLGQSTRTLAFSGIAPTNEEPPVERQNPHGEGSSQNHSSQGSKVALPPSVDPKTFSELPAEMQKELLTEWKSQKCASKMHVSKVVTLKGTKKGQTSSPGSNSLLRYFKPR